MFKAFGVFAAAFILAAAAFGRPFTTDEYGTVDQGTVEIEMGFDLLKGERSGYLQLKHGITPRMDIGAAFSLFPEIGDFSLCWKVRLFEGEGLGMAVVYGWAPGDEGFDIIVVSGAELSKLTLSLNLGGASSFESILIGALAYASPLERLSLGAEIWAERSEDENNIELLTGAALQITDKIVLDLGIGISPSDGSYRITMGCTSDL